MKKIFRFIEWPVYQDSLNFRKWVIENIVPLIPKGECYELTSQFKRASNSVILNIAEGAYRISDKDFGPLPRRSKICRYESAFGSRQSLFS